MFSAQCHTPNETSRDEAKASHGRTPAVFKNPTRGDHRDASFDGNVKNLRQAAYLNKNYGSEQCPAKTIFPEPWSWMLRLNIGTVLNAQLANIRSGRLSIHVPYWPVLLSLFEMKFPRQLRTTRAGAPNQAGPTDDGAGRGTVATGQRRMWPLP